MAQRSARTAAAGRPATRPRPRELTKGRWKDDPEGAKLAAKHGIRLAVPSQNLFECLGCRHTSSATRFPFETQPIAGWRRCVQCYGTACDVCGVRFVSLSSAATCSPKCSRQRERRVSAERKPHPKALA